MTLYILLFFINDGFSSLLPPAVLSSEKACHELGDEIMQHHDVDLISYACVMATDKRETAQGQEQ